MVFLFICQWYFYWLRLRQLTTVKDDDASHITIVQQWRMMNGYRYNERQNGYDGHKSCDEQRRPKARRLTCLGLLVCSFPYIWYFISTANYFLDTTSWQLSRRWVTTTATSPPYNNNGRQWRMMNGYGYYERQNGYDGCESCDEQRRPKTRQTMCLGLLVCFFPCIWYFISTANYFLDYKLTAEPTTSDDASHVTTLQQQRPSTHIRDGTMTRMTMPAVPSRLTVQRRRQTCQTVKRRRSSTHIGRRQMTPGATTWTSLQVTRTMPASHASPPYDDVDRTLGRTNG